MKKVFFLVVLLGAISLVSCATEQNVIQTSTLPGERCDAPVWNIGDSWRYIYSDKREWEFKVLEVMEKSYIVNDYYGAQNYHFDKINLEVIAHIDSKGRKVPSVAMVYYFDFPLIIGKRWHKMLSGTPPGGSLEVNYLNEFKVLNYENVSTPAGTFKAFKIEMKQTNFGLGGQSASGKVYLWYSTEVKYIIKSEYENIPYWRNYRNYDLISFKLVDRSPPPLEKVIKPSSTLSETKFVIVTGTSANIRSGAGNDFSIITTVKLGDKLILLGEHGEWFHVRLENGQEGWINNKFTIKLI